MLAQHPPNAEQSKPRAWPQRTISCSGWDVVGESESESEHGAASPPVTAMQWGRAWRRPLAIPAPRQHLSGRSLGAAGRQRIEQLAPHGGSGRVPPWQNWLRWQRQELCCRCAGACAAGPGRWQHPEPASVPIQRWHISEGFGFRAGQAFGKGETGMRNIARQQGTWGPAAGHARSAPLPMLHPRPHLDEHGPASTSAATGGERVLHAQHGGAISTLPPRLGLRAGWRGSRQLTTVLILSPIPNPILPPILIRRQHRDLECSQKRSRIRNTTGPQQIWHGAWQWRPRRLIAVLILILILIPILLKIRQGSGQGPSSELGSGLRPALSTTSLNLAAATRGSFVFAMLARIGCRTREPPLGTRPPGTSASQRICLCCRTKRLHPRRGASEVTAFASACNSESAHSTGPIFFTVACHQACNA